MQSVYDMYIRIKEVLMQSVYDMYIRIKELLLCKMYMIMYIRI